MDYDPYRDVPCVLCFLSLFVPRNPQALRWKPGDWHAKKKKHKDPNKYERNTVFLSSIQRRIKVFGDLENVNRIQPSLISRYYMSFNQALVTVKKNSLELKDIWENNFNYSLFLYKIILYFYKIISIQNIYVNNRSLMFSLTNIKIQDELPWILSVYSLHNCIVVFQPQARIQLTISEPLSEYRYPSDRSASLPPVNLFLFPLPFPSFSIII